VHTSQSTKMRGLWQRAVVMPLLAVVVWMPAGAAAASDTAPGSATVRTSGYETDRVVTLSFDAGSDAGDVASILSTLRAQGITAAFGLTGRFVEQFPSAARAIAAGGHTIFNHSYSHPDFTTLTQAQRFAELDRTEAAFRAAGLNTARWFRAPYKAGYAHSGLNRDLALRGFYLNVDWTYDTTGYTGASVATILSRVRTYTRPGTIVLGHVGAASTDAEALPDVIRTLREMGYRFTDPGRTLTYGAIRLHYDSARFLGAPRTVELPTSGGRVQWFDRGRIYWSPGTGAREVYGAILGTYLRHADTAGLLGFPLTGERATPDGRGRYNHFQGGSVYWSSTTGAWEVHGAIRAKWAQLGWENSLLGFPTTDERSTPTERGAYNHFQHGSIYWSPTTGAWEVHGAIRAKWAQLGWENSLLGFPTSDEYSISGGRRSDFQYGYITWTPSGGAVVH
jgi:peptidoglycan/xylan/chitin deacetylase (PgdA/CDA1 family)